MKKTVIFEETKITPSVYFNADDNSLVIEGRSIPENPDVLFACIQDWIDNYFKNNLELNLNIKMDYLNSGSSKYLFSILVHLSQLNKSGKVVKLKWLYEEEDEAMLEMGQYISTSIDLPVTVQMVV